MMFTFTGPGGRGREKGNPINDIVERALEKFGPRIERDRNGNILLVSSGITTTIFVDLQAVEAPVSEETMEEIRSLVPELTVEIDPRGQ